MKHIFHTFSSSITNCNNVCLGAEGSKIELFWGGFETIKIKYRLNNSTFRYGN